MEKFHWKPWTKMDKTRKMQPNINRSEKQVIECLKKEQPIEFLPADKGNRTVFMNKSINTKKTNDVPRIII